MCDCFLTGCLSNVYQLKWIVFFEGPFPGGLCQWLFGLYRVLANFLYLLQLGGKLDPKAENKPQKKAGRGGGVSALDIDEDIYLASLILVNNVIFRH